MQKIIQALEAMQNWKETLRQACRRNTFNTSLANDLTIIKLKQLHSRLSKMYETASERSRFAWLQNELKTFHWILIIISGLHSTTISEFKQEQWQLLQNIFQHKEKLFLMYEARRAFEEKSKKHKNWNKEEELLLSEIVSSNSGSELKWNEIARHLFEMSDHKFFRSGKHCRQRWLNHLDPQKKHGQWTKEEDLKILQLISVQGKKWSKITKYLQQSRTEHMVKNRFNSLLIKQQKITPKIKNQDKLIELLKESLKSQQLNIQKFQINDDLPERVDKNQYDPDELPISIGIIEEEESRVQKKKAKINRLSSNQNQSLSSMPIDPAIQKIIKTQPELPPNPTSNRYELQQIFSPFCLAYSPGTITPTYLSPPPSVPFFMNSFAQNCSNFTFYLNSFGVGIQNTNSTNNNAPTQ